MIVSYCPIQIAGKAVLITGCDSGFGFALSKHLHKLGFTVFAGCLLKVPRSLIVCYSLFGIVINLSSVIFFHPDMDNSL